MKTVALLPNWLGDAVMAVPALRMLRAQGHLVGFGPPTLLELLGEFDLFDHTLPYDRRGADRGWRGGWKALRRVRAEHADRVVSFSPSERSAAFVWGSGADVRLASVRPGIGAWAATRSVSGEPSTDTHLAERWIELVAGRGVPAPAAHLRSSARMDREFEAMALEYGGLGRCFGVLSPTATYGPTKQWPLERYVELAERERDLVDTIVIVGGASSRERELCARLSERSGTISLAGRTTLLELASLLSRAHFFVGNDSGPMHLAAAMGTATVGLFTSTSPAWTAPRGRRTAAVGPTELHCAPCFSPSCRYGLECLDAVTVDEVDGRLRELLREDGNTSTFPADAPVIWLDRDGTVLDDPGYLGDPAGVVLLPGAAEAIMRLQQSGCRVVLVTNQSGIGRGLMTREEVDAVHAELRRQLATAGASLEAIYLCPHLPSDPAAGDTVACDCRKPAPGMVLQARRELGISSAAPQYCIGDKVADLGLGQRVGAKRVLVLTGEGSLTRAQLEARGHAEQSCDHIAPGLGEAAAWVLDQISAGADRQ